MKITFRYKKSTRLGGLTSKGTLWGIAILLSIGLLPLITAGCNFAPNTPSDCSDSTWEVTTTADGYDGACGSHCSLRDAVIEVQKCSGFSIPVYTIMLPAGDYQLTLRGPDERGNLNIDAFDMAIVGESASNTFISGGTSWNTRLINVSGSAALSISNLTLRGGGTSQQGGAIYNEGHLDINNVTVRDNHTTQEGGGLANFGQAALNAVTFTNNESDLTTDSSSCGGSVFNSGVGVLRMTASRIEQSDAKFGGGLCNRGWAEITDTHIVNNGRGGGTDFGGGIFDNGTAMTIVGGEIESNQAQRGGGILTLTSGVNITDVLISGNRAQLGGGLMVTSTADNLRLTDSTLDGNVAMAASGMGGQGGGLWVGAGGFLITNSIFRSNTAAGGLTAGGGGGLFIDGISADGLTGRITHSAIYENRATTSDGAGIYLQNSDLVTIENSTLSTNDADWIGDGFYNGNNAHTRFVHTTIARNGMLGASGDNTIYNLPSSSIRFLNTLLAENAGGICQGNVPGITSEGGNYLEMGCPVSPHANDLDPAANGLGDIGLMALTEINGTWVHPLPEDSAAVDFVPPGAGCLTDDQPQAHRPQGVGCEIGAYEVPGIIMPFTSTGPLGLGTVTPTPNGSTSITVLIPDTPCYQGPGPEWGFVNNFSVGTHLELLGAGFTGNGNQDWVVGTHPTAANTNCWLPGDNVTTGIPSGEMRLITVPPLPTPLPTATPEETREPQPADPTPCPLDGNGNPKC